MDGSDLSVSYLKLLCLNHGQRSENPASSVLNEYSF